MWPLILLLSISTVLAQLNYDEGLAKACKTMNGDWKQRPEAQSTTGDTCRMKFQVAARDENDARDFCELYTPWRVLEAKLVDTPQGRQTECFVESTLACLAGWQQMFGHCYMRPDKNEVYTYEEGKAKCAENGGYIAFMHHRYIAGVWKRHFYGIGQIWVNATDTWEKYIQKTGTVDGDALALAFTGKHFSFSVPPNSLIRIDPNIKLELLCEYKPKINAAEINYLGRRYSEIYYPAVKVEHGIIVRSASSYTKSSSNLEVCQKALKPFMIDVADPFVPNPEVMESLGQKVPELFHLTRAGAEMPTDITKLDKPTVCTTSNSEFTVKVKNEKAADFSVRDVADSPKCDTMFSTAITHFSGEKPKIVVMSDSRSLPIWCKVGKKVEYEWEVPEHYATFTRANGEVIAHRLHTDTKSYEDAKKICASEGAVLTGMDSAKEAEDLDKLAQAAYGDTPVQLWLGGRRRKQCIEIKGYSEDRNNICARRKVIQWDNNIAQDKEFEDSWWRDMKTGKNPDYAQRNQECLTFVHGKISWADPDSKGFLDDIKCDDSLGFFCSKKVEMKVKEE